MSDDLVQADSGGSPFDAIRRVRANGSEYWTARDLCNVVEYETWRNFAAAIERAMVAAENTKVPVHTNFVGVNKMVTVGFGERQIEDFELSRLACYLVLMNGDPRKPKIAEAQAYFAIKTRQAEIAPRQQAELVTKADLARMVLEIEEEKAAIAAALESAAPMIAYHDRYISNDDAVLVEVWGAQFGLTRPQAFALLVEHKMIYRRLIMKRYSKKQGRVVDEYEYRAYARYIDWFDLRPQHDVARHHNGQVRQTLYVRQEFALQIADKLGLGVKK
ncbi:phage antirepressor KilAC domain-containing protein [Mycobacterium sp. TY814]|uniref:phage antirepressor KilAC domain-containing protein n=1 Tax=Mycobacterium sp. TY814 TaxID=3050580 RepID=UPI0027425C87|nr:phage antirepressor KilAC domain-containing protein [Mycobacterium sp. TY814]MDP7721842.1 phage antirepressor KilAC domain-containing protein [Mycobacterium sp. TY814]